MSATTMVPPSPSSSRSRQHRRAVCRRMRATRPVRGAVDCLLPVCGGALAMVTGVLLLVQALQHLPT